MFHVSHFTAHGSLFKRISLIVLLAAAAFRLFFLHDLPPGLAQDEILDADIASFIRQGQHALFFREGYGHEPLYHYLAVPLQILLGDNVLSIRLTAVFLGLLLIALTLRWAKREFGTTTAVVAGFGLAVSWWPIIFSRTGIRPILFPVLLVLMAWFWPRRPWIAGLFLGLTLYSYTAARVVFLIPILLLIYSFIFERQDSGPGSRTAKAALIVLFVTALVYLPLHLTLQADPTLQQRVEQLEGPLVTLRQGDGRPVLQMTVATLGVFSFTGDPRWTYSLPGRPLFDTFTALFFYAGFLLAIIRAHGRPRYAFVLIWLVVTLLPSALTPDAPSTVRLVGAMPVVYLLPGLAIRWLVSSSRFQVSRPTPHVPRPTSHVPRPTSHVSRFTFHVLRFTPLFLLTILLTINVTRTVRDGFIVWPAETETRWRYQTLFLEIARHWESWPSGGPVIADSWYEPIDHDSVRRNLGRDLPARWVQAGGAIVFPVEGNGRLYAPEFAPPDPLLLEVAAIPREPVDRSLGQPSFAVYQLPPEPDLPLLERPITFGDQITLLGYWLAPLTNDGVVTVVTYWHVEAGLPWDLASFLHLLAGGDTLVAQHDGLDVAPTRLESGDRFIQLHRITLPEERPSAPYTLQVGLYTRGDGRRLAHPDLPYDRFLLAKDIIFDEN